MKKIILTLVLLAIPAVGEPRYSCTVTGTDLDDAGGKTTVDIVGEKIDDNVSKVIFTIIDRHGEKTVVSTTTASPFRYERTPLVIECK